MSDPMPEVPVIKRPWLTLKPVTWKASGKIRLHGLGLFRNDSMQAHMMPPELRVFADRLHDWADRIDAAHPTSTTTSNPRNTNSKESK